MILRDFSPIPYNGGKLPLTDRLNAMLKFGFDWPAVMKSQDEVVRYLLRLDNSFTLLRNIPLRQIDVTIPFILIGPPGISVIYSSPVKGVFRARGNAWTIMENRTGSFKAAKPNLITRTALLARAMQTFLRERGYLELSVEGILMITHPGSHVDTVRPDVRVVQTDALERFVARLMNESPVLERETRYKLIEGIASGAEPEDELPQEEKATGPALSQTIDSGFAQAVSPLRKKLNFSRRQWLILGIFVAAEIIILVAFLIIIMLTA